MWKDRIEGMMSNVFRLILLTIIFVFSFASADQDEIFSSDRSSNSGLADSVSIYKAQLAGFEAYLQHTIGVSPIVKKTFGGIPPVIDGRPLSLGNAIKVAKKHSPRSLELFKKANIFMITGATILTAGLICFFSFPLYIESDKIFFFRNKIHCISLD